MIVGVNAKIRELYHGFPHGSLSFAKAVERVTGGKRGRLEHLLISHHEPVKVALLTATFPRQPVALDLFGVAN